MATDFSKNGTIMQNLNDYYFFVQVVKYQGYTKASEILGITKSKLSRHITDLESRLNVRLIQRNTRKFAVTDIGQQFYEYCLKILQDVDQAENFIQGTLTDEPTGTISLSCPVALVDLPVGQMLADFMMQYPKVQVNLHATNRRVDLIEEGVDLSIRVRNTPLENSDLIVRELDAWEHVLVAVPTLLTQFSAPTELLDLAQFPTIGFHAPKQTWRFQHGEDATQTEQIDFQPRLKTDNFTAMKVAVMRGVGIASLPKALVHEELRDGRLIQLLPTWQLPQGVIYIAYTSRQGMLPAVRHLLNHLLQEFKNLNINQKL